MHRRGVAADEILRREMGRAGVVDAYRPCCRRRGCGLHDERPTDDTLPCPRCGLALDAKPLLLLEEGVPLAVVQRVMRHSDPALTAEIYGHPHGTRISIEGESYREREAEQTKEATETRRRKKRS